MCHGYTSLVRDRDADGEELEPEDEEREPESADELPAFANREGGDDVELLTGGEA